MVKKSSGYTYSRFIEEFFPNHAKEIKIKREREEDVIFSHEYNVHFINNEIEKALDYKR